MYTVTNPATGELLDEIPNAADEEVRAAIDRVHRGYGAWRARPVAERAAIVLRAAELFAERAGELAAIMTLEMGKRINEGRGEVGVVADIFRYYGSRGPDLLADEPLPIRGGEAVLTKEPIGALLGVMPWNFPCYQVARFVAPNLVLGNTILLKHASICPRSASAIEAVLHDAGVPPEAYVNVFASSRQVPWMLADPRPAGVSLTGSERAGIAVAAEAGRNLKRCVLELGGSDPLIVLDTDDLDETVRTTATARMRNCGQSCNAPKRIIVLGELYEEFTDRFAKRVTEYYIPGDPADPANNPAPTGLEIGGGRGGGPDPDGARGGGDIARGRPPDRRAGGLCGGDGADGRDSGDGGVPRGDLRTGGAGVPGGERGGGNRPGERHTVRAGGKRVRNGPHPRGPGGAGHRGGDGLREQVGRIGSGPAVRRDQAFGDGKGAGGAGDRGVHEQETHPPLSQAPSRPVAKQPGLRTVAEPVELSGC